MLSRRQLIALTIWWAEGTKSRRDKRWAKAVSYPIEVTNTNPAIISIFLDFLRKDLCINEDKLRVQIQVHMGDDVHAFEKYWSHITGVDLKNFNKTIIRPAGRKPGKSMGTCKVRFADKLTYQELEKLLRQSLKGLYKNAQDILNVYEPGNTEVKLVK